MIDCPGFTDPPRRAPLHERDAWARCHKGASTKGAEAIQRESMMRSAEQFERSFAFQQKQYADAQKIKAAPVYAAAPANISGPDSYNAGLDVKRRNAMRFGSDKTNLRAMPSAGVAPLGGALRVAA